MIETQHAPILTVKVQEGPVHCLAAHQEVREAPGQFMIISPGVPGVCRGGLWGRLPAGAVHQPGHLHQGREGHHGHHARQVILLLVLFQRRSPRPLCLTVNITAGIISEKVTMATMLNRYITAGFISEKVARATIPNG